MGRTLAISNQQGGVGKTVTTVNLSAALAKKGYRVLVIDSDAQGNTSRDLAIEEDKADNTTYKLITGKNTIKGCIRPSSLGNLSIIPANVELAAAEIELMNADGHEFILRKAIDEVKDQYDYIIIDCPPSLSLITVNAMVSADGVIIPIQCESYAVESLERYVRTLELVKERLNPTIRIEGILFTLYESDSICNKVIADARCSIKENIFNSIIPRDVNLARAGSERMTIFDYAPKSPGAEGYNQLADEIVEKEGQ